MDLNSLRSAVTVVSLAVFIGIVAWAWSARRRDDFDAAARRVLDDDDLDAATPSNRGAGR